MGDDPLKTCNDCGSPLPQESAAERCRACVFAAALDENETTASDISSVLVRTRPAAEVQLHEFGDYELLEEAARGGMGVVFRAHQRSTARPVALKFILGHRLDSQEARRRFRQEAEAAARLLHPNIVSVYEAGECQGHPFLSMPFIEGETLASAKVPRSRIPSLVAVIARAVHFAHERGILHRDLKPSNILLDSEGTPYVTDFGLAKFADEEGDLTQSASMLGTPRYMSPEQCRSDHTKVSMASDVYALGVILYELLAGRAPFDGDSTLEVMRRVNEETPPPLNLTSRERDLATICFKCLEKEPANRYSSALALAEDLERYDRGEPITARPVGTLESAWKWARRNPGLAAALAVASVALLLGSVISLWQAREATVARDELAASLYAADMAGAFQAIEDGRLDRARALLVRHLPKPGAEDHRGWEWRWFWQATEPQFQRLGKQHVVPVSAVAVSPDERLIAYGLKDGTVGIWDQSARKERGLYQGGRGRIDALAFSPNGRWLAATHHNWYVGTLRGTVIFECQDEGLELVAENGLPIVGLSGSENVPRFVKEYLINETLHFVEDSSGKTVLLIGGEDNYEHPDLRRWDFQDPAAEPVPVVSIDWGVNAYAMSPDGERLVVARRQAGGRDGLRLYQTDSGEHRDLTVPLEGAITSMGISPEGKTLAIMLEWSGRHHGCVLALPSGEQVATIAFVTDKHANITFINEHSFLTVRNEASLQVWRLSGDRVIADCLLHGAAAAPLIRSSGGTRIAVAPSGHWLVTGSEDGVLRRFRLNEPVMETTTTTRNTRSFPIAALVSDDGQIIAANSGRPSHPKEVLVWDHAQRKHISRLEGLPLWLSPNGMRLIACTFETDNETHYAGSGFLGASSSYSEIVHWDLIEDPAKALARYPIDPPLDRISMRMAFPDGNTLVAGRENGEVILIDAHSGEMEALPKVSNGYIYGLAISANQRYLAFTGVTSGIYDLKTRKLLREITPTRSVTNVRAFTSDSRYFAHGTATNAVEIYDMTDIMTPPRILTGHKLEVRSLAFSPDGKTLATVDLSHVLKLWNVATWREMAAFTSNWHTGFSADGRCLITDGNYTSESTEGRLTLRTAPTLEEIDTARRIARK